MNDQIVEWLNNSTNEYLINERLNSMYHEQSTL